MPMATGEAATEEPVVAQEAVQVASDGEAVASVGEAAVARRSSFFCRLGLRLWL